MRLTWRFFILFSCLSAPAIARAQAAPQQTMPGMPAMQTPAKPMDMTKPMGVPTGPLDLSDARDGSGTSWVPDQTPMHAISTMKGSWHLMFHDNVFVQFTKTGGARGDDHFGSVNWFMGMAQRDLGKGQFSVRAMVSLEPLTLGECGYPVLLATGEFCKDQPIHDRQHPHDFFMEVAARYRQAISENVAFEVYGGPAGEPALGPTAYPHRVSAMPNPLAPISHHWLDSTHISFGVLTGAVYGKKIKAEASVFNGREPDQNRYDFDLAALDSVSGRLSFLPNERWALQVSAGHLKDNDLGSIGGRREDVNRVTASAIYHRLRDSGDISASTLAWGRNSTREHATNAVLGETQTTRGSSTWFARGEFGQKTSDDLVVPGNDVFKLASAQLGISQVIGTMQSMKLSVGGALTLAILPDRLSNVYGKRSPAGFVVFVNVFPRAMASMQMHHGRE